MSRSCKFQVNTFTPSTQEDAVVAVDPQGDFVVVWRSIGSGGPDASIGSIQGQRYASDGSTVGGQFQVNTYTTGDQVYPWAAMDADGDFVLVAVEADGSVLGGDPKKAPLILEHRKNYQVVQPVVERETLEAQLRRRTRGEGRKGEEEQETSDENGGRTYP